MKRVTALILVPTLIAGIAHTALAVQADSVVFEKNFATQAAGTPVTATGPFLVLGNSNWSKIVAADSGSALQLRVGSAPWQNALLALQLPDLGLKNSRSLSIRLKLGASQWGNDPKAKGSAYVVLADATDAAGKPVAYWRASNGIAFVFTEGWCGLVVKEDKPESYANTRVLWSTNHKGNISEIELLLSATDYAVAVNGITSRWNSTGASSGAHGLPSAALDALDFSLELRNQDPPRPDFSLDISSILIKSAR